MPPRRGQVNNQVNQQNHPQQQYPAFTQPLLDVFNPRIPRQRIDQNARDLETHTASGPYPHFGETRTPEQIKRNVPRHTYTSAAYPNVMANVNSVTTPVHQTGRRPNAYRAEATLNQRIPTTYIQNNPNGNPTIRTGTTSHFGLYGDGNQNGFNIIRTAFPNPPSPTPPPSRPLSPRNRPN